TLGRALETRPADDAASDASDTSMPALRRSERSAPPVARTLQRMTARLLDREPASVEDAAARSSGLPNESNAPHVVATRPPVAPLLLDNGLGGLTGDGDYEIRLRADLLPPAPWANVVANPHGGFVVTERGAGFAWAGNSYF